MPIDEDAWTVSVNSIIARVIMKDTFKAICRCEWGLFPPRLSGKRPNTMPQTLPVMRRIWRSIFPAPMRPTTPSDRRRFLRRNLILHFRPATVNERTLKFTLSWGMGGMAATLILLQLATGMLLKFVYVPTAGDAYASIQTLVTDVPFGRLVRNLHHWCANLLVPITLLHMLRVFFTGAFHGVRQFNWIIGLMLIVLVLAANLTGYLLPYDQLAYWAVTVIAGMLAFIPGVGGTLQQAFGIDSAAGSGSLAFFYSLHTAVVPILMVVLMAFHFWRIRKAGGLVDPPAGMAPEDEMPKRIAVVPHLLAREASLALLLTTVVLLFSIVVDAPFTAPANPGLSPNPVRAPWYFAGLQELLLHLHPALAVSVVPLAVAIFLVCIPYLSYPRTTEGVWFASASGKVQSMIAATATVLVIPVLVLVDARIVKALPWRMPPLLRDGVLPLSLLSILIVGLTWTLRKRFRADLNETVQSLFVALVSAMLVLTLVGMFFRGAFMQLAWPV